MPKCGNYIFAFLMLFLAALTIVRYKQIADYRMKSQEYTFVVSGEAKEISAVKSDLMNMTYQSVEEEQVEEGVYRLRVRCPPDKVDNVHSFLSSIKMLREEK